MALDGLVKKREPEGGDGDAGAPAWMVTFADLMTLLLTFFILIVAMSTLQDEQIKVALGSLRGALGVLEGGGQTTEGRREMMALHEVSKSMEDVPTSLNEAVDETLARYHSNNFIQIGHTKDGVNIVIDDTMLFAAGSAEIQPGAYPFLADLAELIAATDCRAEFAGHTDDVGGAVPRANWMMGAERAVAVLTHVVDAADIEADRVRAVSYGDSKPVVPNTTPANRARNRRVEITLTTGSVESREATRVSGH